MGYKKRWDKAKTLYEALGSQLDERLKPFVNDYPLHLFEIAFLEEEDVQKFQSDFRIVADYLVQMRKHHDYEPAPIQMRHVREVLNAMAALTQDQRFEEVYAEYEKGEEAKTMSEVLDRIEKRGREQGREEGRKQGREEGREEGRRQGREEGREEGRKQGQKEGLKQGREEMMNLITFLAANGRSEEIVQAGRDETFLDQLLAEYQGGLMAVEQKL